MKRPFRDADPAEVDLDKLPPEVAAHLEKLTMGGEMRLTRAGRTVATFARSDGVAEGVVLEWNPPRTHDVPPTTGGDGVTVVATAMKLSAAARAALSAQLGDDYVVVDMLSAPLTVDVLLVPPASPQAIGGLRSTFPGARIVLAEFDDEETGVSYRGAVHRALDAGAEVYLASTSLSNLARQLDESITQQRIAGNGAANRLQIEPLRDS